MTTGIARRWLLLSMLALFMPTTVWAELRLPGMNMAKSGATTGRKARDEAIRAIPFDRLNSQVTAEIRSVVAKPTIYRRLPPYSMQCDPRMYVFLVRNPEVVVGIWDVMGATQIDLNRTGPFSYTATDGAGTSSNLELVYGTQGLHIYYGTGAYEGSMFRSRLPGRAVLVLRSQYQRDQHGRPIVTSVLDMFLELDNVAIDAVAKTFHPVIGHFADLNFQETVKFVGRLSDAADRNGKAVQRLADRLENVHPDVRQEFARVAANVSDRSLKSGRRTMLVRPTSGESDVPRDAAVKRIPRDPGERAASRTHRDQPRLD